MNTSSLSEIVPLFDAITNEDAFGARTNGVYPVESCLWSAAITTFYGGKTNVLRDRLFGSGDSWDELFFMLADELSKSIHPATESDDK